MANTTVEIPINYRKAAQAMWVNLDKKRYYISVYWNTRTASWYLSIRTSPDSPTKSTAPILPGWIPFRQYTDDRLPPGKFIVVDSSGTNTPPGRYDLGSGRRVSLVYYGATV